MAGTLRDEVDLIHSRNNALLTLCAVEHAEINLADEDQDLYALAEEVLFESGRKLGY